MTMRKVLTVLMAIMLIPVAEPASAVPQLPPPCRISPALDELSLNQGESWGVNVEVSYCPGYEGVVDLNVYEVGRPGVALGRRTDPKRIWAQIVPARVHGTRRVRLEVHAGAHVPLGIYHLIITAKSDASAVTHLIALSVERPGSEGAHAPGKPL